MSKILLIDDSITDRMLTRKILESHGYEVVELDNPENIFKVVLNHKPDLILLDIVMPIKNGYELCRQLKNQNLTHNIPVIFISCKAQKSDIFWGKMQGADDYLPKPYESTKLLEIVEKHLNKNQDIMIDG